MLDLQKRQTVVLETEGTFARDGGWCHRCSHRLYPVSCIMGVKELALPRDCVVNGEVGRILGGPMWTVAQSRASYGTSLVKQVSHQRSQLSVGDLEIIRLDKRFGPQFLYFGRWLYRRVFMG